MNVAGVLRFWFRMEDNIVFSFNPLKEACQIKEYYDGNLFITEYNLVCPIFENDYQYIITEMQKGFDLIVQTENHTIRIYKNEKLKYWENLSGLKHCDISNDLHRFKGKIKSKTPAKNVGIYEKGLLLEFETMDEERYFISQEKDLSEYEIHFI